jgi:xanthine dehydrogenase YagS FAD-binding subunit
MKTLLPFNLVYASSIDDASAKLSAAKGTAMLVAGGTDVMPVLKSRILPTYPRTVISLQKVSGLDYVNMDTNSGTLRIGALAKIADIASSGDVRTNFPCLSEAASSVASPQIRNMGTIGGNLAQQVRCWYYRYPNEVGGRINCLRKGGTVCYAAAGENRYHSIFGGPKGCYAASTSDVATALLALDASMVTNKRTIPVDSFFDPLAGTVLGDGEILSEIDVPTPPTPLDVCGGGAMENSSWQLFTKFSRRASIDFAIASVAVLLTFTGTMCVNARIALGGVAPTPIRSTEAENAIISKVVTTDLAAAAATAAVAKASPLAYNAYKVQILKSLLTAALTPG